MKSHKVLDRKAYHRIPHVRGSHLGKGDYKISSGQSDICLVKERKGDTIIIEEKLDGTSVACCRKDGILIPVVRSGYHAMETKWLQHKLFANWVYKYQDKFEFLEEDQRLCGEWLAQAHGTIYDLQHEPFVAFDLIGPGGAKTLNEFNDIVPDWFVRPYLLHVGGSVRLDEIERLLTSHGHHGATELAEGVVFRIEHNNKLEFMAKYVRKEKNIGCYLDGEKEIWNLHLHDYI
jgi:hypothetical protein